MTPYNFAASVGRALDASALHLLDPGSAGTVTVAPKGEAILVIDSTGARTLQAAAGVDLGARVRIYATASGVSVNSIDIADGGYAVFEVTLDSSAANQWSLVASSAILDSVQGTFSNPVPFVEGFVHDAAGTLRVTTAANDDIGWTIPVVGTSDGYLTSGNVSAASATRLIGYRYTIPSNYVAGSALTLRVEWTRQDAAAVSAALDATVFRAAAPTVDICATAAADVNGAASGTTDFTITPTNLSPGDKLWFKLSLALDDTAGGGSEIRLTNVSFRYTV